MLVGGVCPTLARVFALAVVASKFVDLEAWFGSMVLPIESCLPLQCNASIQLDALEVDRPSRVICSTASVADPARRPLAPLSLQPGRCKQMMANFSNSVARYHPVPSAVRMREPNISVNVGRGEIVTSASRTFAVLWS